MLKKYFGQSLDIVQKSAAFDLKSRADDESEAAIIEVLKKEFPEANIHAEESGKFENGSDYTFIIDPLDGTHNFLLGVPTFTISIGLLHHKKVIAGVIFAPVIDQTFYAELGKGAFLEGKRLQPSNEVNYERAIISLNFSYGVTRDRLKQAMRSAFENKPMRVITEWCETYYFCLLASGKIEGMTCEGSELHDFVAGKFIVREAGCVVADFMGNPDTDDLADEFIVASNQDILKHLIEVVKK